MPSARVSAATSAKLRSRAMRRNPWPTSSRMPSSKRLMPHPALVSAREDALHAGPQFLQPVQRIGARLFRDTPPAVADVIQRLHHRRPVIVALEVLHVEPGRRPGLVPLREAVFLDM